MRVLASLPFPICLAALSLATIATASLTSPIEPVTPELEIALSAEPIRYREQVRSHSNQLPQHSVWQGTYVCAQGLASVTLTVDVQPTGAARARYDFGPVPSNPVIPKTGAFILVGTVQHHADGGFTGELEARKWIVRPEGYFMVPLSIASEDGRHLRGRIHHDSCSQFQATRIE